MCPNNNHEFTQKRSSKCECHRLAVLREKKKEAAIAQALKKRSLCLARVSLRFPMASPYGSPYGFLSAASLRAFVSRWGLKPSKNACFMFLCWCPFKPGEKGTLKTTNTHTHTRIHTQRHTHAHTHTPIVFLWFSPIVCPSGASICILPIFFPKSCSLWFTPYRGLNIHSTFS